MIKIVAEDAHAGVVIKDSDVLASFEVPIGQDGDLERFTRAAEQAAQAMCEAELTLQAAGGRSEVAYRAALAQVAGALREMEAL